MCAYKNENIHACGDMYAPTQAVINDKEELEENRVALMSREVANPTHFLRCISQAIQSDEAGSLPSFMLRWCHENVYYSSRLPFIRYTSIWFVRERW